MQGQNGAQIMTAQGQGGPQRWRPPKPGSTIRRTVPELIFDSANMLFMWILLVVMLFPFWYVLVLSFNEGRDATLGGVYLWPRMFTLENYAFVLGNPVLWRAYYITISRTITGSLLAVAVTGLMAYSLSKRHLPGRIVMLFFLMLPMFIGGTMVSRYIVYSFLGMLNTFWVYILPTAFNFFHMIIIRTFIYGLPVSMEESAKLDGAGYMRIFVSIVVPLCIPVVAVIFLFNAVTHWLDFSTNLIFVTDRRLRTAQYLLHQIVLEQRISALQEEEMLWRGMGADLQDRYMRGSITPHALQMTTLVIVTVPILFLYPFIQRFFIQGVRIGAIKE